jgi:transketolase
VKFSKEPIAMIDLSPFIQHTLHQTANTIRQLTIEAVERAQSGHPGLPMGCAEMGAYLYGYYLRYDIKNPKWLNRDRFILSAGHGSLLLYTCLHLAGFNLSIEDIKNFRQMDSKTPSHPEYQTTESIESSTGVDGQGVGHAVGQALGMKLLSAKFNTPEYKIIDSKVLVLAGDGCLMEGISSEASSLAGHLQLDNLILIYDSNKTSLDGFVSESCSEDIKQRYQAYGWDVYEIDGHNLLEMHQVLSSIRLKQTRPVFILAHTTIGKGSPNKSVNNKILGEPLLNE